MLLYEINSVYYTDMYSELITLNDIEQNTYYNRKNHTDGVNQVLAEAHQKWAPQAVCLARGATYRE